MQGFWRLISIVLLVVAAGFVVSTLAKSGCSAPATNVVTMGYGGHLFLFGLVVSLLTGVTISRGGIVRRDERSFDFWMIVACFALMAVFLLYPTYLC